MQLPSNGVAYWFCICMQILLSKQV